MIKTVTWVALLGLVWGGWAMLESTRIDEAVAAESTAKAKKLRHVVLFKFKDGTKPEQIQEIVRAFAALPQQIDAIRDFEWGTDISVENLAAGYTHCFVVTFADEAGRDRYLPHPAHQAFVNQLRPILDRALVVDFWAQS